MSLRTLLVIMLFTAAYALSAMPSAMAQTFSYDGNRWYEIEVSIFTNESSDESNELVIPEKISLSYFEPSIALTPASKIYQIPFTNNEFAFVLSDALIGARQDLPAAEAIAGEFIGPRDYSPDGEFRITDFNRDPFIALGNESARFLSYNEKINQSPEHRLLFHAVWRQPVLNRVQSTGILVQGGDQYGLHHELEGSLRFSYNVNRVDVEAKLWLASFVSNAEFASSAVLPIGNTPETELPPLPVELVSDDSVINSGFENPYSITDLAYMEQMRAMISNELHYLDHPALGIIVEVRPYQLPEQSSFFD